MRITIPITGFGNGVFRVAGGEGVTRTVHEVRVTPEDVARYAPGAAAGRLVKASFELL